MRFLSPYLHQHTDSSLAQQNFNWGSTYSDTACKEPIIHIASPQPSQPEPFLASVSSGPEAEIPVIQSKTDSVIYDALSSETETGLHLPSASAEYMLTEIESEFYPTNPFCPDTQESLRSIEGYVRREGSYLPCACGAELSHTFPLTTTPASPLTPSSNLGLVSPRSPSPSSGSVSPSDILIFTYPPFTPVEVTADEVAEVNNACLAKNAHAIYPEAEVEVRSPSSECVVVREMPIEVTDCLYLRAVHEMHSHPSHYFKDYANLNVAFYETPALDSSSNFLDNIGFESHPMLPGPPCSIVQ